MKNKPFNKTVTANTGKDILKLFNAKKDKQKDLAVVSPSGETEEALFDIWKTLLHHENFGVNNDFFQVGGNSIKGIQLVARINRHFSVQIGLTDIFLQPTIAQIASLVGDRQKSSLHSSIITVQPRPDRIPLSFSQERLWFIDRLEGSVPYHLPVVLRLKGNVNKDILGRVFQEIVNRHEALRTVIDEIEGQASQKILEKNAWQLEHIDGSVYSDDNKSLQKYIDKLVIAPFDLSKDHMVRCTLISLDQEDHFLVVTMHHIAADAWSMTVIVNEVVQLYASFIEGGSSNLAPLPLQYADYALWQRNYLQGEILDKKIGYWKDKLRDVAALQLPVDHTRPSVQKSHGASLDFKIDKELSAELELLCQQEGTTIYMTLLAAFN
ncbi:MAG: condensation domain-containing protein, partial [Ferruginibacter sp.]